VALAPDEVRRAQSLAVDICSEIQGFLHSRLPDMPLGEMSLGGSLLDDLQVHALYSLVLSSKVWMVTTWVCVCVCLGGQCGPRVSAGASPAGSLSVASHPGRGDAAHTPAALDGPTGQSGIFPQRTQLLGQVITHK